LTVPELPINADESPKATPQILIAATFTAIPLEDSLKFWTSELGLPHQVAFAPYQQLFQTLVDPAGSFASNPTGANLVMFRLEDLEAGGDLLRIEEHFRELGDLLIRAAGTSRVPLIACVCPPSGRFLNSTGARETASRLHREFSGRLANRPNLYLISADKAITRYQVATVEDPIAERTGHVPYDAQLFTAVGTEVIRRILALERKPVKVIAFDCDNTLWTGVCGEDGPQGVAIDEGRRALQTFLLQRRETGTLLAICSKNNEADVRETFAVHPEMVLAWDDITAHRINWDAKSQNLLELAVELNLGLDSFVFLDDDAKECGEVQSEVPEAVTLQIPHRTEQLSAFLDHVWLFDQAKPVTAEDRRRTRLYAEQLERSRFERQAANLRDFLAGLRLEILFAPVSPETLPRAAQLTQRTNQMNTSLVRYTEAELEAALSSGQKEAFTTTVSDRFGSYGLVGLVIFGEESDALRIDNFLLSCRALGRGVEHQTMVRIAEIAAERGKDTVRIAMRRGPRNQPAVHFVETVSGVSIKGNDELEVSCSTGKLASAKFPDVRAGRTELPPQTASSPPQTEAVSQVPYQHIAESLNTAARIQAAIASTRRDRTPSRGQAGAPPHNELQARLALIWCELLGLSEVGIDEDFFDLGGHSLLAVQLLSRIHQDLGTELPDSVIYGEKLRIDNLARAIELQRLGIADQQAYEAMLAEVESLSDEEVAALLAQAEGNA
jgi:FkbH-like protein